MDINFEFELLLVSALITVCPLSTKQEIYCCRDFEMIGIEVTGIGCVKLAEVNLLPLDPS